MKILQLCKKFPYPLKDGESIAVTYMSRALKELGCEITLLAMNTLKHHSDVSQIPEDYNHYKNIHFVDIDSSVKPLDAFLNLFSNKSYNISRFISNDFKNKLVEVIQSEDFDVIQLETLYLAPYVPIIKEHTNALVAMRAHNVEHEIWDRITHNTSFYPKKWYLNHLAKKLKKFEVNNLNTYDLLIAITERDLGIFRNLGYQNGAIASPIGIDINYYKPKNLQKPTQNLSMSFIGSLDWLPNLEGLNWFLNNIWEEASKQFPNLELHVAGRNTPGNLLNNKVNNVKFHGEVPDAMEFINEHPVMIVPLQSGSGMRVKILEGMALGKLVITTSVGLEGIHAKHKEQVLIANTPGEFVEAIAFCDANPDKVAAFGNAAKVFVQQQFDNKEIAKELFKKYNYYLFKEQETA